MEVVNAWRKPVEEIAITSSVSPNTAATNGANQTPRQTEQTSRPTPASNDEVSLSQEGLALAQLETAPSTTPVTTQETQAQQETLERNETAQTRAFEAVARGPAPQDNNLDVIA